MMGCSQQANTKWPNWAINLVTTVRMGSILGWIVISLSLTRSVYDEYKAFSKDTEVRRDYTDREWNRILEIFSRMSKWFVLYALMSKPLKLMFNRVWKFSSIAFTLSMALDLFGPLATIVLFFYICSYWLLALATNKFLLWITTLFFIYSTDFEITQEWEPRDYFAGNVYYMCVGWITLKGVSFCHDAWETRCGLSTMRLLLDFLQYMFYFPTFILGPVVSFKDHDKMLSTKLTTVAALFWEYIVFSVNLFRLAFTVFIFEATLHYLHIMELANASQTQTYMSASSLFGILCWIGLLYSLKYKAQYGLPCAIAKLDGLQTPELPMCPACTHRYSELWRKFDVSLYEFLKSYIKRPLQVALGRTRIPTGVQNILSTLVTFGFVVVWHNATTTAFIWTSLNFFTIACEIFGKYIKRGVDYRWQMDPLFWDFVVEPIVSVPLVMTSIWANSIFCGNINAAYSIGGALLEKRNELYMLTFALYTLTHASIAIREQKLSYYKQHED